MWQSTRLSRDANFPGTKLYRHYVLSGSYSLKLMTITYALRLRATKKK